MKFSRSQTPQTRGQSFLLKLSQTSMHRKSRREKINLEKIKNLQSVSMLNFKLPQFNIRKCVSIQGSKKPKINKLKEISVQRRVLIQKDLKDYLQTKQITPMYFQRSVISQGFKDLSYSFFYPQDNYLNGRQRRFKSAQFKRYPQNIQDQAKLEVNIPSIENDNYKLSPWSTKRSDFTLTSYLSQ